MKFTIASVLFLATVAVPLCAQTTSPLPPDKILASNHRVAVTYADFEAEIARIPPRDQFEFLLDRQRLAQLIDNMLLNKTLAIEARENKLDSDEKVQAEIRNQTEKVLAKYRGQQVQRNAPAIDYLPRAREIYLANPERFTSAPMYDVWHVLVNFTGRSKEQALARANDIRSRVLAGESPEQLALTMSDDASARDNKGIVGLADLKNFDVRFAAVIKKLKVGELSPVFESEFGYHITRLREYKAPAKSPFDAVKPDLIFEAETQYLLSVWENHLRKIRNDPKLFVDTEALEALRPKLPPVPPPGPTKTESQK